MLPLLQRIHTHRSDLRKSELKVCEYVLDNIDSVIHMRIVDLADVCDVSEPTVVRFCRAIECNGFQDFKLQLAQHLASKEEYESFSMDIGDSTADLGRKVFNATLSSLTDVRDALNPSVIEQAIKLISNAKRVEFYGFGASAAVAADAQHKFFRLNISSAAYSDPHIQAMSAMSLSSNDVVVAISQSGKTTALIEAIQLANAQGAMTIGLAPTGSPVAKECQLAIEVNAQEEVEIYTPLSSRIAHLVIIDLLAVGVAQSIGPEIGKHLQAVARGLQPLRQDK